MVHKRIHVVGATAQDNAYAVLCLHLCQNARGLIPEILSVGRLGLHGLFYGLFDLPLRDVEFLGQCPCHGGHVLGVQIGGVQLALALQKLLCVEAHNLRIAADNRAAVAVKGFLAFHALAGNAGIENVGNLLFYEVVHMPVGKLCREAHCLRGHGGDAKGIDGLGGDRRKLHTIA